jgi:hypothetical protein
MIDKIFELYTSNNSDSRLLALEFIKQFDEKDKELFNERLINYLICLPIEYSNSYGLIVSTNFIIGEYKIKIDFYEWYDVSEVYVTIKINNYLTETFFIENSEELISIFNNHVLNKILI